MAAEHDHRPLFKHLKTKTSPAIFALVKPTLMKLYTLTEASKACNGTDDVNRHEIDYYLSQCLNRKSDIYIMEAGLVLQRQPWMDDEAISLVMETVFPLCLEESFSSMIASCGLSMPFTLRGELELILREDTVLDTVHNCLVKELTNTMGVKYKTWPRLLEGARQIHFTLFGAALAGNTEGVERTRHISNYLLQGIIPIGVDRKGLWPILHLK